MLPISYDRHRFPPEVIRHAIWLYARFTVSYRDVRLFRAQAALALAGRDSRGVFPVTNRGHCWPHELNVTVPPALYRAVATTPDNFLAGRGGVLQASHHLGTSAREARG